MMGKVNTVVMDSHLTYCHKSHSPREESETFTPFLLTYLQYWNEVGKEPPHCGIPLAER